MSTPNEKTSQAKQDDKRRAQHFQVRLDSELAKQLQHYADAHHDGVRNAALKMILSKFFNGK
jgi:ribosomal protein L32|tara:strand:+ start:852 stop:1037 length:186 start_codon:yes stop_codon:yes gene_type:complete